MLFTMTSLLSRRVGSYMQSLTSCARPRSSSRPPALAEPGITIRDKAVLTLLVQRRLLCGHCLPVNLAQQDQRRAVELPLRGGVREFCKAGVKALCRRQRSVLDHRD